MKNSKRISRILANLQQIEEQLDYFSNSKGNYSDMLGEIKAAIAELSLEQKEHDIRLIKKWEHKHGKPKE